MQPANAKAKLDALTGLRYLAAMTVVVTHVSAGSPKLQTTLLASLSAIGMPLFFTLSGFLMCYNYYADFAEKRDGALRRFYVARIARIYPVYLVALALSLSFMGNFFHDLVDRPFETLRCLGFATTLTQSWIHSPAFADYMNSRTVTQAYLGVSWSVSTEMFFYATFPFVIPLLRRLERPATIVGAIAAVWCAFAAFDLLYLGWVPQLWNVVTSYSEERWLTYLSPYGRIGEFWMGCLVGRLFGIAAARPAGEREVRVAARLAWACIPAMLAFTWLVGKSWVVDRLHLNVGLAPVCCLLIYCLARYPSALQRMLAGRTLVLLGESSYCLFLLHSLVQSFFAPRTPGEGELSTWFVLLYNHLMMFAVLHLLALGLYQFVELPLRTKIRNWLAPRPAIDTRLPEGVPALRLAA